MTDWADCPNCSAEVRGVWRNLDGEWDGPPEQRPYTVPLWRFHDCAGTFDTGAAVAFGLLGMAEAIRAIEAVQACPRCHIASGAWTDNICNQCWDDLARVGRDGSKAGG